MHFCGFSQHYFILFVYTWGVIIYYNLYIHCQRYRLVWNIIKHNMLYSPIKMKNVW